jgi:hypothetical protein
MKCINKILSCLIIVVLVLFFLKPESAPEMSHQLKYNSSTSPCSGSSRILVSFCSSAPDFTLTVGQFGTMRCILLFSGLLYFLVIQLYSSLPLSSIFRPPISIN